MSVPIEKLRELVEEWESQSVSNREQGEKVIANMFNCCAAELRYLIDVAQPREEAPDE